MHVCMMLSLIKRLALEPNTLESGGALAHNTALIHNTV